MLTDILADCFLPTNKITLAQIVNHEKTIFDKKIPWKILYTNKIKKTTELA